MENSGLEFDHIINSKLENLSEQVSSQAWEAMSERLDVDLPRTEDQIFDSILRKKVSSAESTVAGNWSAIDDDLDKIKSIDDQRKFDKIIYNKVGFVNYDRGANWEKLLGQMEEWDLVRRKIVTSRIVEVFTLIVLLMVGFGSFNADLLRNNQEQHDDPIALTDKTETHSPSISKVIAHQDVAHQDVPDQNNAVQNSPYQAASLQDASDQDLASSTTPDQYEDAMTLATANTKSTNNDRGVNDINDNSAFVQSASKLNLNSTSTLTPDTKVRTAQNSSSSAVNNISGVHMEQAENSESSPSATASLIDETSVPSAVRNLFILESAINPLTLRNNLSPKTITPIIRLLDEQPFKDGWSLALSVSLDEHFITTDDNNRFNLSALQRFNGGYGGAVRLNRKSGNWNIETGFAYHYVRYEPLQQVEVIDGGSFTQGYEFVKHASTELYFVEIPVEIQYGLFTGKKLRMYANVGASANVNIVSKYTFERFNQANPNASRPAPIFSQASNKAPDALKENNEYSPGALEKGGSISNNSYFTANIGVGVDYRLTDNMDLFFQTTYHHRVGNSEIGPYDDRFQLTSFNLGARFPLRK